jgi:two-component system, sensor histidine kinase RegB
MTNLAQPQPPSRSVATAPKIGLAWLVRLRWGAILGQLVIVGLAVSLLDVTLPFAMVLPLLGVTALSNAFVSLWLRRGEPTRLTALCILMLDVLTLTGLLLATGGASNPFSVFYLVSVALAALLVDVRHTWLLAGFTSLAFGSLFILPTHQIDAHAMHMHHAASSLHLQGMWFAYTLAAGFVAHFVSHLANSLREREREVAALQRASAQNEKLASLSTLAAGAAHELGTPLATIAIVSKELERALSRRAGTEELGADARLIRDEVERCREILARMAADAGAGAGEMPTQIALQTITDDLSAVFAGARAHVEFETNDARADVVAPRRLLVQVLTNLVKNALDSQTNETRDPVRFESRISAEQALFEILDRGSGIPEHLLGRVGEPFFTTKPEGRGLGLGVFLARAFAERMGGALDIGPRSGGGTRARLVLPRDVLRAARVAQQVI